MVRIIDASVAVKWFVDETNAERAQEVLIQVMRNPENFVVPELFFFELSNTLYRLAGGKEDLFQDQLVEVLALSINRYPFSNELMKESLPFQKRGLSAYDAAYAALARLLEGLWLTFDSKAHRQIEDLGISRDLGKSY